MEDDTTSKGTEHAPVKHEGEEVRPVVWTPEDASRFLSNAIHEAQKPLADALKQRPATTPVLALIVAILVVASVAIGWILSNQLSKSESAAETARTSRDSAVAQQYELKSKADTLEASLAAARDEQERLSGQVEGKRDSEEELRKVQSEVVRFRRQNDLLKNQIAGLELEKQALSRQLEAVKAMAIDEEFDDYVTIDEPPVPGPATSPAPEAAPKTEPEAPPAESPETPISKVEPPSEEALNIGEVKSEAAPEAPAAKPVSISDTVTPQATTDTIIVEQVAEQGSEAGTLTVGVNGQNPPTLYEATRMMESAPVDAAEAAPVQITSSAPIPAAPAEPEAPAAAEEPVKEEPAAEAAPEIEQPRIESEKAAEEPASEEPKEAEEKAAEAPEPEESAVEEPAASTEPEEQAKEEPEPVPAEQEAENADTPDEAAGDAEKPE